MANILDGLIEKISDRVLRDNIASEVARLRGGKEFGLVFERHLPESVRLFSYPIARGVKVQDRTVPKSPTWTVTHVKEDMVILTDGIGMESQRSINDLVVVREFGEPIYPGLKSLGRIRRGGNKPFHCVINAENYHALETLCYNMDGQADVLYLDPPYNSGAKDWTYNNDYVDENDMYRHSKWLSFMEKRLVLGSKLLRPDSVMVVTIDEHEVTRLGVLLHELFPQAEITLVTIVINPKGVTRPGVRRFSRVEEYAYFCFFGNAGLGAWGDDLLTLSADDLEKMAESIDGEKKPRWKGLLRSGTNARREDRKNMFYPVLIDEARGAVVDAGSPLPFDEAPNFEEKINGLTPVWPVRQDLSLGNWGVGPATLQRLIAKGYVALGSYDAKRRTWAITYLSKEPQEQIEAGILLVKSVDSNRNVVEVVYADPESAARRIKTVWHRTAHDAGSGGTDVISRLLNGRRFSFPKSVYAVRDILAMLTQDNKNALIIDFFGGSGTTTHATMMLNREDRGHRRCILVTNNEVEVEQQDRLRNRGLYPGDREWEDQGIFYRATKPRLEAVVTGKRADGTPVPGTLKNADGSVMADGHEENIEFYELTYLDRNQVSRGKAFEAIAPLLWMKVGSVGSQIERIAEDFAVPPGSRYGVLFNVTYWRAFIQALADRPEVTYAFIVTDSLAQYQQVAAELPNHMEVSMLYEDYLRTFEINTGRAQ